MPWRLRVTWYITSPPCLSLYNLGLHAKVCKRQKLRHVSRWIDVGYVYSVFHICLSISQESGELQPLFGKTGAGQWSVRNCGERGWCMRRISHHLIRQQDGLDLGWTGLGFLRKLFEIYASSMPLSNLKLQDISIHQTMKLAHFNGLAGVQSTRSTLLNSLLDSLRDLSISFDCLKRQIDFKLF